MCGRYSLFEHLNKLGDYFRANMPEESIKPRYNAAPSQYLPIVSEMDNTRSISHARWGFIPSNAKKKPDFQPINARAETVDFKWPFKTAFARHQRCLIPASGFYEWKRKKDKNLPWHIQPEDEPFFAFAGLYDHWESGDSGLCTFTIITTSANPKMQKLHDRMPVVLLPDEFEIWLSHSPADPSSLKELCRPLPNDLINLYPVSTKVNNFKNEGPELVKDIGRHNGPAQTELFD